MRILTNLPQTDPDWCKAHGIESCLYLVNPHQYIDGDSIDTDRLAAIGEQQRIVVMDWEGPDWLLIGRPKAERARRLGLMLGLVEGLKRGNPSLEIAFHEEPHGVDQFRPLFDRTTAAWRAYVAEANQVMGECAPLLAHMTFRAPGIYYANQFQWTAAMQWTLYGQRWYGARPLMPGIRPDYDLSNCQAIRGAEAQQLYRLVRRWCAGLVWWHDKMRIGPDQPWAVEAVRALGV